MNELMDPDEIRGYCQINHNKRADNLPSNEHLYLVDDWYMKPFEIVIQILKKQRQEHGESSRDKLIKNFIYPVVFCSFTPFTSYLK